MEQNPGYEPLNITVSMPSWKKQSELAMDKNQVVSNYSWRKRTETAGWISATEYGDEKEQATLSQSLKWLTVQEACWIENYLTLWRKMREKSGCYWFLSTSLTVSVSGAYILMDYMCRSLYITHICHCITERTTGWKSPLSRLKAYNLFASKAHAWIIMCKIQLAITIFIV